VLLVLVLVMVLVFRARARAGAVCLGFLVLGVWSSLPPPQHPLMSAELVVLWWLVACLVFSEPASALESLALEGKKHYRSRCDLTDSRPLPARPLAAGAPAN
jgi:hypothetical protein